MKTKILALFMSVIALFGSATSLVFADANNPGTDGTFKWGFGNSKYTTWIAVKWTWDQTWDSIIWVVKSAINWVLWILSLVVLVLLLWGGFQMITAAGDDAKYKKGFTILKQAGIWLAFIATAWLIVSLIFFVIQWSGAAWNDADVVNAQPDA